MVHPATRLTGEIRTVDSLNARLKFLDTLTSKVGVTIEPRNRLAFARRRLEEAGAPLETDYLKRLVEAAEDAFLESGQEIYAAAGSVTSTTAAGTLGLPAVAALQGAGGKLLNVTVLVVIVAAAVASVAFGTSMPSTTFGTSSDYWKLLTAAVSAGAVGVLAALRD